jgi:agmatinase
MIFSGGWLELETGPALFADAHSDLANAMFVVMGVPYDATATFRRGAREGPAAIRKASYNFETWLLELGMDLDDVPIHDAGDVPEVFAPSELVDLVEKVVSDTMGDGRVPIMLGGEHNATEGAVRAMAHGHPDLSLLVLDAHLDFRDSYLGEPRSHSCVTRRCAEVVGVDRTAVLGVRSVSPEEMEAAQDSGLAFASADRVREEGLPMVLGDLLEPLGEGPVYMSLDLDVLDPSHAPAVQNPEPWGLTPLDVRGVIDEVAGRLVGFDVMECAPVYDGGQTALVAARLARHAIGAVWQDRLSRRAHSTV